MKEKLAELAHKQWSDWMKHLFDKSYELPDGNVVIPSWAARRWKRQMNTPYSELPEDEKKSDREEADRVLELLRNVKI